MREKLEQYLKELAPEGLCVAFSGGVDSAVLLYLACRAAEAVGGKAHAVTMYTPFHSPLEPEHAKRQAAEYGAVHHVVELDAMPEAVMGNPPDRCYLCKGAIFTRIRELAAEQGLRWVLDGTNAGDLREYRPGLRALRELEIKSPLAELGMEKSAVRELAAELGLEVASKPSAPCLATRFPYGAPIDVDTLRRVDGVEEYIKGLGFPVVRARVHGDLVRVEVPFDRLGDLLDNREQVADRVLEAGFRFVSLDLEGFRSGSMDRGRTGDKPWS